MVTVYTAREVATFNPEKASAEAVAVANGQICTLDGGSVMETGPPPGNPPVLGIKRGAMVVGG